MVSGRSHHLKSPNLPINCFQGASLSDKYSLLSIKNSLERLLFAVPLLRLQNSSRKMLDQWNQDWRINPRKPLNLKLKYLCICNLAPSFTSQTTHQTIFLLFPYYIPHKKYRYSSNQLQYIIHFAFSLYSPALHQPPALHIYALSKDKHLSPPPCRVKSFIRRSLGIVFSGNCTNSEPHCPLGPFCCNATKTFSGSQQNR